MLRPRLRPGRQAARIAGALAALAALGVAPASAEDLPTLLQRLSAQNKRVEQLRHRGVVTMTTRTDQLDRRGRTESHTESVERVSFRNGTQVRELVAFTRDGVDRTAEEKARRGGGRSRGEEEKRRDSLGLDVSSPFAAGESGKYRFALRGADSADPNRLRIGFEPAAAAAPGVNVGEALVDAAAGVPIRIRFRPSVHPKHVERMEIEMEYGDLTPEGPALSKISIEGVGGFLFIKKKFRTTIVLAGDGSSRTGS